MNVGEGWTPLQETRGNFDGSRSESVWKWSRPSVLKSRAELTLAERSAEDVLDALEGGKSSQQEIREKLAALRKARDEAGRQLRGAQLELRKVVTFEQEAKLVLMGWLD